MLLLRGVAPLCVLLTAGTCGAADIRLVGGAEKLGERLRLTRSEMNQVGAAWLAEKHYVRGGFEANFEFQLTEQGGLGGADGFALVLQNSGPGAIGNKGSAGGFGLGDRDKYPHTRGIPRSLAVFFDVFRNEYDPSDNYIAICANGTIRKMKWPPARMAMTKDLPVRMKDGRVHAVRISYRPPVMSVWMDGGDTPVLRAPVDLSSVLDERGQAFVGFTASTGAGFQNHDILNWTLTDSSSLMTSVETSIQFLDRVICMEGRNLCTPKDAVVEDKGEGQYHVILPAHIAWAASVPNPAGRKAVTDNVQGNICRDLKSKGADGCSGSDRGLINTKNERGRTWFSVEDAAPGNEGFFEFDVAIRP
jgi:hypothetical protein